MKASETDILIVPGRGGAAANDWSSRWAEKLSTARLVSGIDWMNPDRHVWVERIVAETRLATRPVVLIGHGLGVAAAIHAAHEMKEGVAGGFFVAPPDLSQERTLAPEISNFGPYPRDPLRFPAVIVASRNDAFGSYEHAEALGAAWGSLVVDAGESGAIDAASGHGPWPEGSMVFGHFLGRLQG